MFSSLLYPSSFHRLVAALGVAALGALGFALVSQYGFGLKPCHLCIWQRWPYLALAVLGAVAGLGAGLGRAAPGRLLWGLSLVLLALESGLAAYHSAVERHLISGPTECTSGVQAGMSLEALRAQILGAAVTRCDEPVWLIPPLTMANANLLLALALLAFGLVQGRRLLASTTFLEPTR